MNKHTMQGTTIGATAIRLMKSFERKEADIVVAGVKARFPKSKFDRRQFHFYHSKWVRGLLDAPRRQS